MSLKNASFKNWVFTSYDNDVPFIYMPPITYAIMQKEICPTTKKKHWQGYMEFSKKITMKTVKEFFYNNTVHLEPRKGSQEEAMNYCKKSETAIPNSIKIYGKPARQGNRTDLDSIFEYIDDGHTVKETLRQFGGHAMRYVNHIEKTTIAMWDKLPIDQHIRDLRNARRCYIDKTGDVDIPEIKPI